jgi:enterochelin esterase-like enzyme
MKKPILILFSLACATLSVSSGQTRSSTPLRFEVSYSPAVNPGPLDGRMFLYISKDVSSAGRGGRGAGGGVTEPRLQISDNTNSQQFFGLDVDGLKPGAPVILDVSAFGYPVASLRDIPAGDYYIQGMLNIYTTFHRSDGHTVKLPMDEGEGQHMERKPGNLFSKPVKLHVDHVSDQPVKIVLDQKIPPIAPLQDTEWIKHVHLQSQALTKFWGRPMFVDARVVLPPGWAEHPTVHYPVMVEQGHFTPDVARSFRRIQNDWAGGKLPKFLWVVINHANPFYDDSYAVNSANVGPYGDAIMNELIPAVEKQFRGIGQGWARTNYGCSTGGWEALADQIFYPDFFNGAWGSSPDPVDFHAYQIVDLYNDKNAYWIEGPWDRIERANTRRPDGNVTSTMDRANHRELVLGTHGRSGDQYNIWQAVFGPVASDGYPANVWDPMTGIINKTVVQYWHDHFDLTAWLESHWSTLAPKLDGKLHIAVGDEDTYYLDNAVYMMEEMMNKQTPKIRAEFDYGRKQPHCYDGTYGRLSEEQLYMPKMSDWIIKTAPAGADMSWRY